MHVDEHVDECLGILVQFPKHLRGETDGFSVLTRHPERGKHDATVGRLVHMLRSGVLGVASPGGAVSGVKRATVAAGELVFDAGVVVIL